MLLSARVPAAICATMLDWELGYCQSQGGRDCFFLFEMHLTFSLFHAVFGLLLPVLHLVANPCTSVCLELSTDGSQSCIHKLGIVNFLV